MVANELSAASVEVPCTCGELVQGVLNGEPFLVSCPIERYSHVTVALDSAAPITAAGPKARRAARATLELLGERERCFDLRVTCPLPPSKGFGTSTADVVGAILATSSALGARLSPVEVARLAVSVEPSDGTMFPGLALFNHRSAERSELLGAAPPLIVAVLEFGGGVDTIEYNARLDVDYLRSREAEHAGALELLRHGLQGGRWELIGRAATLSARINQGLLPKPDLEKVIGLGQGHGALGVCAAHSGTVLGVLFEPEDRRAAQALLTEAGERLAGLTSCWITRMVGGGARACSVEAPAEPRQVAAE